MSGATSGGRALFATCTRGVEEVLAGELIALGMAEVKPGRGGVHFAGEMPEVWRANLWLRTANHVLWPLGSFPAHDADSLYAGVRAAAEWTAYLQPHMAFAVDVTVRGDAPAGLRHTHFVALRVKDAIVDAVRDDAGARPSIDTKVPDLRIHAHLEGGTCALSLDSSGESLHRRGYRSGDAPAPLKETLAAALVLLSGWRGDTPLLDPMCGSGTLIVEAALIAANRAPGLSRRFGFEGWLGFDRDAFTRVHDEAAAAARPIRVPIAGSDVDPRAITQARRSLTGAGLGSAATLFRAALDDVTPPGPAPGMLICNPPYGERVGEADPSRRERGAERAPSRREPPRAGDRWGGFSREGDGTPARAAEPAVTREAAVTREPAGAREPQERRGPSEAELFSLYKRLGTVLKQRFAGYTACVFTGNLDAARAIGLSPARRHVLWNGAIECRLLRYELYAGSKRTPKEEPPASG